MNEAEYREAVQAYYGSPDRHPTYSKIMEQIKQRQQVAIDFETMAASEIRGKTFDYLVHDDVIDAVQVPQRLMRAWAARMDSKMLGAVVTNGNHSDGLSCEDLKAERNLKKMQTFAAAYGTSTGRTPWGYIPPFHNLPKEPNMTPTEQLKQAQDAVVAAQKAVVEQAEREAFLARVSRDIELANATFSLLNQIASPASSAPSSVTLAKFRNELNPLALTYGHKLVLVGDKTRAALVKV